MKKSATGATRLLTVILFLISSTMLMAQTSVSFSIKQYFPRNGTYEHQMLKTLNINPEGLVAAYDEQKPYAQLTPLQQIFGRLSLLSAEIFATDLTPGYYDAPKLMADIARIPEFKGRVNGILAVLVMYESSKDQRTLSNDPNAASIMALKRWSTDLFRSMKVNTAKAVLDEFHRWKNNPCAYKALGYSPHPNCATPNWADLFATMSPPHEIIAKAGLEKFYGEDANNVAHLTAMAMTGITITAAAMALSTVVGTVTGVTTTGAVSTLTLGQSFGYFGAGSMSQGANIGLGAAGWGSVVAAPLAAAVFAMVVGTIEGFRVVEAERVEPMLKAKLGAAMSDYINISNALADISNRDMFFLAFTAASKNSYKVVPPSIEGEVRFYCQAGYVSRFKLTYKHNVDKTGYFPEYKTAEFTTKDLNVGSEETFVIPAGAKEIRMQGWYLAGTWKSLFNQSYSAPTYTCYTSYGTIFDAKYKKECPEVASVVGKPSQLTITQGGGYTAWYKLTYNRGNQQVVKENKGWTIGRTEFYQIPFNATNIKLVIKSATGLVWDPWKTIIDKTWPEPPNECIRVYGTALAPKWNNECQL